MPRGFTHRVSAVVRSLPLVERLSLGFLRFLVGVFGAVMASGYILFLFHPGFAFLVPDESLVFKLIFGFALAAPFSVTSFLACGDLLGGASHGHSRTMPCGIVAVGCGIILSIGAVSADFFTFIVWCGMALVYLVHFLAAALAKCKWCRGCGSACRSHRSRGSSRAAMLYRSYFGINGTLYVWKVAALQLVTIVLQATTKIELLGMAVAMEGAVDPAFDPYGIVFKPMYWVFNYALMLNVVYPTVLLRSTRYRLQRDVVAAIDVLLDMIYFLAFCCSMYAAAGFPQYYTTAPFLYASILWPLVHVVATARAIETAAVQRRAESDAGMQRRSEAMRQEERTAARQRLPAWAAAGFLLLAGFATWLPYLIGNRDRYPITSGDDCRPCACSDDAVLQSCDLPATLGVMYLYLDGKSIRGIAHGAFRGLSILNRLDLSRNNVSALPVGAFDGLSRLRSLDLSANAMDTLGTGVFASVPALMTLILRDTPLAALRVGALAGLGQLRNLFLDGSDELRMVDPGVFNDTLRVAHVWVGGSALNCTRLGLPSDVACFDDVSCDAEHITWIGGGTCSGGEYDTAACAWDGGDCA